MSHVLLLAALFPVLVPAARADIAPSPDYVETCTVEQRCTEAEEGKICSASFQGREDCAALETAGWTKKCQTSGASVWSEVFCRPKAGGTAAGPPPVIDPSKPAVIPEVAPTPTPVAAEPSRCGPPGEAGGVWIAGLLALGLLRRVRG
ncbi:MAG: hypothetical protein Q8P41_07365 [Pseudomonadota bacterium]|nr:hypothetical protein [Pseudomonadota bacterium]